MTMRYPVLLIQSEEGFSVSCPLLPGCVSQGDTEAEALENIRIAIVEYLDDDNELPEDWYMREVEVAV
jgi:predicted RNase H-like HicB family nuclease